MKQETWTFTEKHSEKYDNYGYITGDRGFVTFSFEKWKKLTEEDKKQILEGLEYLWDKIKDGSILNLK